MKSPIQEKTERETPIPRAPALEEGVTSLVQGRYLRHWLSRQTEETRNEIRGSFGVSSDREVLAHRLWYAYPDSTRLVEFLARHVPDFETKLQNGRVNGRMLTMWKSVNQVFGAGAHEIVAAAEETDALETIGVLAARLAATGNAQAGEDLGAATRELRERSKKAAAKSSGGAEADTLLGMHAYAASTGVVFAVPKSVLNGCPLPDGVRRSDAVVDMLFVNVLAHEMHHATGSTVIDLDLRYTDGTWDAKMKFRRELASHVPGFSRREAERNEKIRVEREEFRKTHVGSQKYPEPMGECRSERQPGQEHLEAVLRNVDTVDGIDLSLLLTRMGPQRFRDALRTIAEKYKAATGDDLRVDLTFAINDPEITKNYHDKKSFLRALKGLLDNSSTRKHIARVTVKGPKGTKGIEPNVFESDIRFEETDV